jgi:hypothetical protein
MGAVGARISNSCLAEKDEFYKKIVVENLFLYIIWLSLSNCKSKYKPNLA